MKLRNDEELIINKVKKEDAKEMIEYLNLIGGESDNLTFGENGFNRSLEEEQNFIEELSKAKTSALLVGRINDEIVCTASIISPTKERLAHQCTIGMSVKKKYWNNGIATYLLSEVISFARENGVTEIIHLGVRSENIIARKLYKKFGFEEIGINKKYFKIDEKYFDEILMNLYL